MTNEDRQGVSPRRRCRCWLFPVVLLLMFVFLLPVFVKCTVNRVVIPSKIADPKIPLISGGVEKLTWFDLQAGDFQIDAGNGMVVAVSDVEAAYSPASLAKRWILLAGAQVTSGPEVVFNAGVSARDIYFSSGLNVQAAVSAQCSRITTGPFSAGPIHIDTQIDGTDANVAFDVPLQDGLLTAHVVANAGWQTNPVFNVSAHIPLSSTDGTDVQLGGLVPNLDDLTVSGNVVVELSGGDAGMDAVGSLTISRLEYPAANLNISNLTASCALRFPGELRSLPEQELQADRLSIGDLQLDRIRMHYQLEPESVLYIEDLEFNWCDGRISLFNTRINPQTTAVDARLFCDHLSLEKVLSACGLQGFSGGGQLNGRLPVRWDKEGLVIDHGFLFTTPGKGGTFAFGAAEVIAGVLPPQAAESGQVGLVTAALAEFNYDWITLEMNSEGEGLKVAVEVAGMPANVLPYEYDSTRGTYVKVELKSGRGLREPMVFHFNFDVQLDQLLWYGSGINRQWNWFKGKIR